MNFKVTGTVMMICAAVAAVGGTAAEPLAQSSVSVEQQGKWAVGCFYGDISQCEYNRDHDREVKEWKDRGVQIMLGAGAFFILGASLFAGSLGQQKQIEPESGSDTALTEEEADILERLEREAVLKGPHR
jgi:hypothetical protein